jgi:ketosteroid isomerase-like protein
MTGVSCHDGAVDASAEVHQAAMARATALAAGDAKALRELLHEQFRWTTHVGQVFDRDEYIRRNTAGVTEWRSQTLGPTDISIVGAVAVLLTVVTDVIAATEAEDAKFRMPVTQVWVRSRGKWQCLAGHAGPRLG